LGFGCWIFYFSAVLDSQISKVSSDGLLRTRLQEISLSRRGIGQASENRGQERMLFSEELRPQLELGYGCIWGE
jgi:hypothetical protein